MAETTDTQVLREKLAARLADIEATVAQCYKDTHPPNPVPPGEVWFVSDEPCELCAERLLDGDVIREALAALSPAPGDTDQAQEVAFELWYRQYAELRAAVDPRGTLTTHRSAVALAHAQRQDSDDRDEAEAGDTTPAQEHRTDLVTLSCGCQQSAGGRCPWHDAP